MLKRMNAYFGRVAERSSLDKGCNKDWNAPVSRSASAPFEELFKRNDSRYAVRNIETLVKAMTKLMLEYVGPCKGSGNWNNRKNHILSMMDKNVA